MRHGQQIDMLHGPLSPKIIAYALPLAATSMLQQLFNAADIAVVGRFVGNEAMAAVGSDAPLVSLIINFFVGLSLGATVVIASAIGRRDPSQVHDAVHTAVLFSLLAGIAVSAFFELIVRALLDSMAIPPEVYPMALSYMRIYVAGLPVILLYNFLSAVFRADGNTRDPLIALTVSGIANVALNLFFVLILHRDVDGVAWATVISNAISSALLFWKLSRTQSVIRLDPKKLRITKRSLAIILRIGVPGGIQSMMYAVANIFIQSSINSLGTIVMAGSSAAYTIEALSYDILNAFAGACTTFVGQNNGAAQRDRCRATLRVALLWDYVFTTANCALLYIFGRKILLLFTTDPAVMDIAMIRMKFIFLSYFFFSISGELFAGYLRGYGVSLLPALISVFGICIIRLIYIFTFFPTHHTFWWIMMIYPISLGVTAVGEVIATLIFEHRTKGKQVI